MYIYNVIYIYIFIYYLALNIFATETIVCLHLQPENLVTFTLGLFLLLLLLSILDVLSILITCSYNSA